MLNGGTCSSSLHVYILISCPFSYILQCEICLWQEDCRKEKRDFLHSLSKISMSPKTKMIDSSRGTRAGSLVALSPQVSSKPGTELVSMTNKPIHEKKAYVYAEVVKKLNSARERGLPFKVWPSKTSL